MLVLAIFCLAIAAAVLCPDIPAGRMLRRVLIEAPAAHLSKWTFAKAIPHGVAIAGVVTAVALAVNLQDGIMIWMMLPEALAWIVAFDAVTFLELSLAVWFAAANVRLGAMASAMHATLESWHDAVRRVWRASPSARAQRAPRKVRRAKPAADDDGFAGLAWA